MNDYELQQQLQEMTIKQNRLESYNSYLQEQITKYRKQTHEQSLLILAMKEERQIKWKFAGLVKCIKARIQLKKENEKLQRELKRLKEPVELTEKEKDILAEVSIRG